MNHANSPNISVIVPFVPPFDEDLLDLTLFSLSGQNSVSLEIILQVSGSERQSVIATDIVGRQLFNKGLVRSLVIQQIQAYGMASWAQTWDSARGDYLCILEPQSVLYPNALSILVSEIEKSSFGYAVGGSKRSLFKRNGRLEPVHVLSKKEFPGIDYQQSDIFLQKKLSLSSCLLNRSKLTPNIFERSLDENASQSYQLLLNLSVEAKGSISKSNKSISEIYLERKDEYERTEVFMGSLLRKQQAVISRFSRKFGFQIGKLRRFLVSSNKRLDVMR